MIIKKILNAKTIEKIRRRQPSHEIPSLIKKKWQKMLWKLEENSILKF